MPMSKNFFIVFVVVETKVDAANDLRFLLFRRKK